MGAKIITGLILTIIAACIVAYVGRNHFFITEKDAFNAAKLLNLREVKVDDRDDFWVSWNGCRNEDKVSFEMSGKNASGENVNFVVCCNGVFSGCTTRTK